mgnify:CR=1 FL=1|jgi:mevalonate kinase|tara:strand:+ start:3178 stop:4071 length:894 start_codon:yes stop_codon:yes gene_type:complete
MVIASAPGKVILFGEHAVVFGEPSIAGAINKRVIVEADRIKSGIKINSTDSNDYRYVEKAVEVLFDYLGKTKGVRLKISSQIPPASGLGSSAAVSVATILSVSTLLNEKLERKKIAQLGHQVEREVQGVASPTDTFTSVYGGVQYINPLKNRHENLESTFPLVVGYTGIERSTKNLVNNVAILRNKHPDIIDPLIKQIGEITKMAKMRIINEEDFGDLMNINHGILESLGVSTEALSKLVHVARDAGAIGAKITGAGGGGCIIAYTPLNKEDVIQAISDCKCLAIDTSISLEGVKLV